MRQFDVCQLKSPQAGLVVVLQHTTTGELATRIVAPLSDEPYRKLIDRLRFEVNFQGQSLVVQIDRLAALPLAALGPVSGNLEHERDRMTRALNLLFFGV